MPASSTLTNSDILNARLLTLLPITTDVSGTDWDNSASFAGFDRLKSLNSIFRFDAKEGATYDISSSSFFAPYFLTLYDSQGNKIGTNQRFDDPFDGLIKSDVIFDWIAPYTGAYYVDADWSNWTKSENHVYSLSIYEDVDTVTSSDIAVSTTTLSHLTSLGITAQQANNFIMSHVNDPDIIFNVAKQNSVTTFMLSEITGFSTSDISGFFVLNGLNTEELDAPNNDSDSSVKRDLLSSDMSTLANIISFNDNSGALSTAALRESILSFTGIEGYNSRFNPSDFKGYEDGIFTPEEFGGISHLGNIPATRESLESLFYGTAINAIKNFSFDEFTNISLNNDGNYTKVRELEINAYGSPTSNPVFNNDADVAFQVKSIGISGWLSSDGNDNPPFLDGILIFV